MAMIMRCRSLSLASAGLAEARKLSLVEPLDNDHRPKQKKEKRQQSRSTFPRCSWCLRLIVVCVGRLMAITGS